MTDWRSMEWMSVGAYAQLRYDLRGKPPSKAQVNSIYNCIKRGTVHAVKSGGRWFIAIGGKDERGKQARH